MEVDSYDSRRQEKSEREPKSSSNDPVADKDSYFNVNNERNRRKDEGRGNEEMRYKELRGGNRDFHEPNRRRVDDEQMKDGSHGGRSSQENRRDHHRTRKGEEF